MMLLLFCLLCLPLSTIARSRSTSGREYDYIVIGAGSAGAVVANRLSEIKDITVALIEAGRTPSLATQIPGLALSLVYSPEQWDFLSVPQSNACLGLRNQQTRLARGKVEGGTSAINLMLYVRGNRRDYDRWAQEGATGWSFDEILPYFIKSERNYMSDPNIERDYHGTDGPMSVNSTGVGDPLIEAYLDAARQYTGARVGDYNGRDQTRITYSQAAFANGTRASAAQAYLSSSVRCRKNLHIMTGAHVDRVLFTENRKAYAVMYRTTGGTRTLRAKREIIISTGGINTPKMLMLSGIGPKDHLQELGIPVLVDLPVGKNLQDHTSVLYPAFAGNVVTNLDQSQMFAQYLINRTGPLSTTRGAIVFTNSGFSENREWPDLELHMIAPVFTSNFRRTLGEFWNFEENLYQRYSQGLDNRQIIFFFLTLLRPKSKGFLMLRSSNPNDQPLINPMYLTHEDDVNRLIDAVKMAKNIINNDRLIRLGIDPTPLPMPACQHLAAAGDAYYECIVRSFSSTTFHQAGMCRMGQVNDKRSVVSPTLEVIGVQGLRVVDASVMPFIVSGNTNAAVTMIAEKASDLIKDSYLRSRSANYRTG